MPFSDHHNLDVTLAARGDGYAVTVTSPRGEFRGRFRLPFVRYEVENLMLRIGARTGTRRVAPKTDEDEVRVFGTRLFDALFHGDVEQALRSTQDLGDSDARGVRVRLRLRDAPELAALPWEYLYDPRGRRPIALSTQTPLVRYVDMGQPVRSLEVVPPLRILAVMASPRDVEELDIARELQELRTALQDLVAAGLVEIHGLHHATPSRLRQQLGTEAFHIVHFMGHGAFDEATGIGMVLLEDDDGGPLPVSGHDLGLILHDHDDMRMVVLNACEGGRGSHEDPVGGVAQSMVHHDIPAVVGMQAEITDAAATTFSEAFYRHLAKGEPVDVATAEARMKLYLDGFRTEWGIPILYLRAQDGRIFDLVEGPTGADVRELEQRADRLQSEGTKAALTAASGLIQRVQAIDPDRDEAASRIGRLERETELIPAGPRPPLAPPPPIPAPPRPAPSIRPVPPAEPVPHGPSVVPPAGGDVDEWVPTPARSSRLVARVASTLDRALELLDGQDRVAVEALHTALHEPLRIAVAGPVGAGKSTLVNALLGRQVAPTDTQVASRVVTWYRYGSTRATAVHHDGSVDDVGLVDGGIPGALPWPVEDVDRLEVSLPLPALRRHTIIDTPGMPSLIPGDRESASRSLLGRSTGPGGAPIAGDAMVYVFRGVPERGELERLGQLLEQSTVLEASAVTAIGVFGHADDAGEGPWGTIDPVEAARHAARTLATGVRHRAADVVAVSGLMAQAARTGGLDPADVELLAALASEPRASLAGWAEVGAGHAGPERLEELVRRCGPYVLARGREEAQSGSTALAAWMDRRSGVPALEDTIRQRFLARATALKANNALVSLAVIARRSEAARPAAAATVQDAIERARTHRDLHPVDELEALRVVAGVDADLHRELTRVSGAGSVVQRLGVAVSLPADEIVECALRAAAEAQRSVVRASDPRARAAARVLQRSYRLIADEARALHA